MSSAVYPLGMESYNNRVPTGGYETWKGTGSYSNPVAITAGNIRPLTNKDPTNIGVGAFGRARPLKQYRKGTTTPVPIIVQDPNNSSNYIYVNTNRAVKSSTSSSLIDQTIFRPGQFSVKHNPPIEINESFQLNIDCKTCDGIGLVTSFSPETYLTNNPREVSTNNPGTVPGKNTFCCNPQKNALKLCRPASTNLKKNYYQTLQQYRENRCQTYEQRAFNFKSSLSNATSIYDLENNPQISQSMIQNAKPGDPIANLNLYVANCYPNTDYATNSPVYIIAQAYQYIKNAGLLTPSDIQNYNSKVFTTFSEFNSFLSALSSGNSVQALKIFTNILSNPYLGMRFSGPSNPRGCKLVVYKPSNPQFANQGGVMSSARTLKLGLTTIEKYVAGTNKGKRNQTNINFNVDAGSNPGNFNIYKSKTPLCNAAYYTKNGDPKTCDSFRNSLDYQDKFVSQLGITLAGPNVSTNGISTSWS
uniref:Uncharacterized protein n=1 Tax=viral metagenome TaxID=1070528 RepID=A0A6C0KXI6_9ZZZZ